MSEREQPRKPSIMDMAQDFLKREAKKLDITLPDVVTVRRNLWGYTTYEDNHHNKLVPDWSGHHSQCKNGATIDDTRSIIRSIEAGHAGANNNPTLSTFLFEGTNPLAAACKKAHHPLKR